MKNNWNILLILLLFIFSFNAMQEPTERVGDVKYSVLPPAQFEKMNPGWVLMDGDNIDNNSSYTRMTGQTALPDARGLFIRGMNHDGGNDPQQKRIVGHSQLDGTRTPYTPFHFNVSNNTHAHSHIFIIGQYAGNELDRGVHGWHLVGSNKPEFNKGVFGDDGNRNVRGTEIAGHEISIVGGGDNETRPKNIALYIYIKIN